MKKFLSIPLLACLYSSNTYAIASDLLYIRADITATKFNNISLGTSKFTHNYNLGGIVGLGYYINNKTRVELIYNNMLADRFKYSNLRTNTYAHMKANIHAAFARINYDFLEVVNTTFFIGGGVGIANVNHKFKGYSGTPPNDSSIRSPRKNNMAYTLMFGGSIKATDSLRFETSYSFMDYGQTAKFRSSSGATAGQVKLRSHNIALGLRYDLI